MVNQILKKSLVPLSDPLEDEPLESLNEPFVSLSEPLVPLYKPLESHKPLELDEPLVPLMYNPVESMMNQVMLIDNTVKDYQLFVNGCNSSTLPIVYDYHSDMNELKQVLSQFTSLDRIAIVFHDRDICNKIFLNSQSFFNTDLKEIVVPYQVKHLDFLACNTLQYEEWNTFYEQLQPFVTVGASNDETGNIKYGGNWLMENTNEDVKSIYFNETIDTYTQTLVQTPISSDSFISIAEVSGVKYYSTTSNDYSDLTGWNDLSSFWPIQLVNTNTQNTLTVDVLTNITITDISQYFIIGSDNITFDGHNNLFTIQGCTLYPGLIQNGTSSAYGKNNITIKNIKIPKDSSSTLAISQGWVCQKAFCRKSSGTNVIDNCENNNDINYGGGIVGERCGAISTGIITIKNCINSGIITYGGGIVGNYNGFISTGTLIIENCSNTGLITLGGGIVGERLGESANSNITVRNCTNSGVITEGGGIVGKESGYNYTGTLIIENCSNTGLITNGGGIAGEYFGEGATGNITIRNCTNSGVITNGGGIAGDYFGYNSTCTYIVENCSNTGNVLQYGGGIISNSAMRIATGSIIIRYCTNSGSISGGGGIVGSAFGLKSTSTNRIEYCSNTGNILTLNGGDITGYDCGGNDTTTPTNIQIKNCYSTGIGGKGFVNINKTSLFTGIANITISNCYTLYNSFKTSFTTTNVYEAGGTWNSLFAINNLLIKDGTEQIWVLNKSSEITSTTLPFVLYAVNPTYDVPYISASTLNSVKTTQLQMFTSIPTLTITPITDATYNSSGDLMYGSNVLSISATYNSLTQTYTLPFNISISNDLSNNIYIKKLTNDDLYLSTSNNDDDDISTGTWYPINNTSNLTFQNTNSDPSSNGLVVKFLTNINITNNNYYIIGSDYITIDGNNKSFTVINYNNVPYNGLIQNGTSTTDGKSNIVIKNIKMSKDSSLPTINVGQGWVCQSYFCKNSTGTNIIDNCENNNDINTNSIYDSGGIMGESAFRSTTLNSIPGTYTIRNCINTGNIYSYSGGICANNCGCNINKNLIIENCSNSGSIYVGSGIVGRQCGYLSSGNITIRNCTNSGSIIGKYSGGIAGYLFGVSSTGINIIENCTNSGLINGEDTGGIVGQQCGQSSSSITIRNCANSGSIIGDTAGGIVGYTFGRESTGTNIIENCTNSGSVTNGGGIAGVIFGYNSTGTNIIENCTNSGSVTNGGGIAGYSFGANSTGTNIIKYCSNTGNITNGGHITANNCGYNDTTTPTNIQINHCYSTGTGNEFIGIIDDVEFTGTANITISNCYSLYSEFTPYIGSNIIFDATNIYPAGGTWSLQTAKSTLLLTIDGTNIWGYDKTSGIKDKTKPFILLTLNPTYDPVFILVCFKEGSKILTDQGYRLIEELRPGDLVKTELNDYKPIVMMGKKEIYHPADENRIKDQLYQCSPQQYPELTEELIITGCHCILVDDLTDEQRTKSIEVHGKIYITGNKYRLPACVDERTSVYDKKGNHIIYHLALENEHYYKNYGIYANGLLVETCSKRYLKELSDMELHE